VRCAFCVKEGFHKGCFKEYGFKMISKVCTG
jgi:hypothetical protein